MSELDVKAIIGSSVSSVLQSAVCYDDVRERMQWVQQRLNRLIADSLEGSDSGNNGAQRASGVQLPNSTRLMEAMAYSSLDAGKRIRPALCYAVAESVVGTSSAHASIEQAQQCVDACALSIELVHSYSLVHDDLPAMDDDDLRRGKPSNHIAYDEATAILVGDALQALAFECLARADYPAQTVVNLVLHLAQASGFNGMVYGQMLDIEATNKTRDLADLEQMHRYKTGKLIEASLVMPAIALQLTDHQQNALQNFGRHLGLCFQICDDILDVTSDTDTLGKPQGSDRELNKATYVQLLGLDGAKSYRQEHLTMAFQALQPLDDLGANTKALRQLAQFVVERTA